MTVTSVRKDPEALTMTITAELDATVERAWQLWADPRQLERWWGPPTYPATVVDHDLGHGRAGHLLHDRPRGRRAPRLVAGPRRRAAEPAGAEGRVRRRPRDAERSDAHHDHGRHPDRARRRWHPHGHRDAVPVARRRWSSSCRWAWRKGWPPPWARSRGSWPRTSPRPRCGPPQTSTPAARRRAWARASAASASASSPGAHGGLGPLGGGLGPHDVDLAGQLGQVGEDLHVVVVDRHEAAVDGGQSRCLPSASEIVHGPGGQGADERGVAGQEGDVATADGARPAPCWPRPRTAMRSGETSSTCIGIRRSSRARGPWPGPSRRRPRSGTPARAGRRGRR